LEGKQGNAIKGVIQNQGCYSIAISSYDVDFSQELTQIPPKSIVLNATNQDFSSPLRPESTYVKPIRYISAEEFKNGKWYVMAYELETGEIGCTNSDNLTF
jgi:hypothetical protein